MTKEYDLIGVIGSDITAIGVQKMLAEANGEDVVFYIASLGGALDEGLTINGLIKKYSGKTKGVIIGNTASAGTIAILGCNEVECNDTAPFLIHNSSDPYGGNAVTLRKKASDLERLDSLMVSIYQQKTGLKKEEIQSLMAQEDWLLPDQAKSLGFVDSVIPATVKAVAYKTAEFLTENLLQKLQNKMNLFNKKKEDKQVFNVLALAGGKQLLINAELPAKDVEVAAIGAATLENGTFELADGRTITVTDGVITEVMEKQSPEIPSAEIDEIVGAVSTIVKAEIAKVKAEITADIEKLRKTGSKAELPKGGGGTVTQPSASVHSVVSAKVKAISENLKQKMEG